MDTVFTILECLRLITEIEFLDTVWIVRLYLPSSICDARTNGFTYLMAWQTVSICLGTAYRLCIPGIKTKCTDRWTICSILLCM